MDLSSEGNLTGLLEYQRVESNQPSVCITLCLAGGFSFAALTHQWVPPGSTLTLVTPQALLLPGHLLHHLPLGKAPESR